MQYQYRKHFHISIISHVQYIAEHCHIMCCSVKCTIKFVPTATIETHRIIPIEVFIPDAIAVSNGTVGLRLALHLINITINDEVLIPPLSFVATANSISHLGAVPHFVDIDLETLGLCPKALEKRLQEIAIKKEGKLFNKETNRQIKAVMPVHVFGNPAKAEEINSICKQWNLQMIYHRLILKKCKKKILNK